MSMPVLSLFLCVCLGLFLHAPQSLPPIAPDPIHQVIPAVETEPIAQPRDAADDPAIWVHPTDPSLSTIIGTNKQGSLEVYDLSGHRLQVVPIRSSNVDIRYNFPFHGERIALVVTFSKSHHGLAAFKVNTATRLLESITADRIRVARGGTGLYHSPLSGKYYYFSNSKGILRQYELFEDRTGELAATLVREVAFGTGETEGVVADDVLAQVYVSEEGTGIWKLSAEPDGGDLKTLIDTSTDRGGHLVLDVEGLTIYYKPDSTGYLIASSQGNDTYTVYTREGVNAYIATFSIGDSSLVDGTADTDGIDITNVALDPAFPYGVFVAQDGKNTEQGRKENQNFKLVDLSKLAAALGLSLDTTWDPRLVGADLGLTSSIRS
jgi:3-phytase